MIRVMIALMLVSCAKNPRPVVSIADQERIRSDIDAFRRYALEPALIAPPTFDATEQQAESGALRVVAKLLPAESAAWNAWPDGTLRLFNNRVAHLFEVEIAGDGPIGWIPAGTTLELNDPETVLVAAPGPEVLLHDLVLLALQAEQQLLDSGLTERTRGAGAFRSAYLAPAGSDRLRGLIAFPLWAEDPAKQGPLSEKHVVAMRLTLAVVDRDGPRQVEIVYE